MFLLPWRILRDFSIVSILFERRKYNAAAGGVNSSDPSPWVFR
jgi:hypothetical protein